MKHITLAGAALLLCGSALAHPAQHAAPSASTGMPGAIVQVAAGPDAAATLPKVEGAWVRATVPGQQATGAFMRITAPRSMQLVGAQTPAAALAEVHEMKMDGSVMQMRPVDRLELPAGAPVELKPGGFHLMLQQLKQPLPAGGTVALTLLLRETSGAERRLELKLPVLSQAPGAAANGSAATMHKH